MAESKAKREVKRRTEAARRKVDKATATARAVANDPDLERLDAEIAFAEKKIARLESKEKRVATDLGNARENLGMLRRVRARAENSGKG